MPINKAYKLPILMDTIKEYIDKTNRRVTIEYVMEYLNYVVINNVRETKKKI